MPAISSDNEKLQAYLIHIVKEGESLSKIAYEYYLDYNQTGIIAEFNNIRDINKLKIGQEIKIPVLFLEKTSKPSRIKEEDLGSSKKAVKTNAEAQASSQKGN